METISDISERVEFIEVTLKNCKTLLQLLHDVDDVKYVQEDIGYALYNAEEISERYCTLADRIITQKSIYRDMCKERIEFQNRIEELENKLGIVAASKKTGLS